MMLATYALQVDGRSLPPVRAVVDRGRALVPIRVLAEALTAEVNYEAATQTVIVRRAARTQRIPAARIVAGHAFAPLRVVAEALGARVTYDAAERRIALNGLTHVVSDDVRAATQPTPAPVAPAGVSVHVLSPAPGAAIDSSYPTISAQLLAAGAAVDPASVRLALDSVALAPTFVGDVVTATVGTALPPGTHTVALDGADRSGTRFSATWSFVETASVSQRYAPVVAPLANVYLDHYPAPGDRTFDVIAYGAPGASGYVTIDGVPGGFPLFPTSGNQYVSHVLVPLGVNQPYARVEVHLSPAVAAPFTYTLPTVFSLRTVATPQAVAPAGATTINGGPRRALGTRPTPSASPVPPTPMPTPVVRRQASPRPKASASPRSRVPS